MEFEILIPEKQKKQCLKNVVSLFLKEISLSEDKEGSFKLYIVKFYDALSKLPFPFQIKEAENWIKIIENYGFTKDAVIKYTLNENEKKAYGYILDISVMKADFKSEFDGIKSDIKEKKKEIFNILDNILKDSDHNNKKRKKQILRNKKYSKYLKTKRFSI